jgi:hypothetical protein
VDVLGPRALNRALLARQFLLDRVELPPIEAIGHLVGLQAQAPAPPYYGLWSRIAGFDRDELGRLLIGRELVRIKLMRGTVHMVGAADAAWLRPVVQVAIERGHNGAFGRRMGDLDTAGLTGVVGELLADGPLSARELAGALIDRGIGDDPAAIANATLTYAALVQVPPRGVWGRRGQARYATLESWTGLELETRPADDELVFGDEHGRELFDLPDAPRPDPGVRAGVRLLGEYDNVLLGHADRRRIVPESFPRGRLPGAGRAVNQLLVDGMLSATWTIERDGASRASVVVEPSAELTATERDEIAEEGLRMLEFATEADRRSVEFVG